MHAMCRPDSPMGWPSEQGYTIVGDTTDSLIGGVYEVERGGHPRHEPGDGSTVAAVSPSRRRTRVDRFRSIGIVHSGALGGRASHAPVGAGIGPSPGSASTSAYRCQYLSWHSFRHERRACSCAESRGFLVWRFVTRYIERQIEGGPTMPASSAERMRALRLRRRARGTREIRIVVPDARLEDVRARVADSVSRLDRRHEADTLRWIEAVSEFDETETR